MFLKIVISFVNGTLYIVRSSYYRVQTLYCIAYPLN